MFLLISDINMLATACRASRIVPSCKQLNSVKPILFAQQNINIYKYKARPINTTSVTFQDENKSPAPLKLSEDSFVKRMYNKMFSGVPVAKLRASGYILLTTCSQGRDLISR